jgi:hypothetical protein
MNDIKDALTKVADSSAPAPLALEHVRGRARQIRRRRTATAIVGSAAAVAAITGLGVAVVPTGSHDDSLPPATQTPQPSPPSPSVAADPNAVGPVHHVKLDVPAEQTFNNEPQVPYWLDGRIIDTDGSATPFPDRPFTFAQDPTTGDWVVIYAGEANALLVRITDAGKQVGQPVPSFEDGLAVGPRGEIVTVTQHSTHGILTEGDREIDLGSLEWTQIHGVLPNGDVLFQGADGGVTVAHVDSGELEPVPDTAMAASSLPTGLVAYGRNDGTWEAVDPQGSTRWSLDWAGVNSFSPDGRHVVLVGDPQHRVEGSTDWDSAHATSTLWIRTEADLLPVAAFVAPEGGYFWNWTWDGDELLATVFTKDRKEWSLVRLSADGYTVGRAMTQPGNGEEPAYVFAAQ